MYFTPGKHNCTLIAANHVEEAGAAASTYQRLLGEAFAELSPVLQAVHGPATEVRAQGWMRVRHGRSWLIRLVNALTGVPGATEGVRLQLAIHRTGGQETWERRFGRRMLRTRQWAGEGWLFERSGPLLLSMRVQVEEGALVFLPGRAWLLGLRMPRWCSVLVSARATANGAGWDVWVESRSPLLGMMFEYTGHIEWEA